MKKEKEEIKNKFIAIKTQKVYCNKIYKLTKDKEIPKDLPKEFHRSLLDSKIIKRG